MTQSKNESWSVVHIITQLELGGAQLATFTQVSKSQLPWKSRHLLFGPGGILEDEAQKLEGVQCWGIPHLGRSISPLNELRALFEIQRMHFYQSQASEPRRLSDWVL